MAKIKTTFETEVNSSYPNHKTIINIIGQQPENKPYVSITTQIDGHEISYGWITDIDLERFAVNILKALKSKNLK